MNNIFKDDYYIDVTGDNPTLYKVCKYDINELPNSVILFIGGNGLAFMLFINLILMFHVSFTVFSIISLVWLAMIVFIVANLISIPYLNQVNKSRSMKKYMVTRPSNLTVEKWNNFLATSLIDKTPNEYGKIWIDNKERKNIDKFISKNRNIVSEIYYEKQYEQYRTERNEQNNIKAKKIEKYKNSTDDFVEKNITNNIQ